ncbi:hypothetical protein GDO81_029807 [Engystomops pustulosus]|uniref:G-protein coupled receptors family 1 profile domain-containing protein n=1 Tax=Engystomops pustulosus TaxID=76066 RepID=A0AAV6YLV1_ENGPU|nr:hypothetical protein GDO81_029807 [Engystomops pustulosus]
MDTPFISDTSPWIYVRNNQCENCGSGAPAPPPLHRTKRRSRALRINKHHSESIKATSSGLSTRGPEPHHNSVTCLCLVSPGLIVLTLAVCWMPNQALRIMAASVPKQEWTVHYFRAYMSLLPVADTFFYLSSVVNPLLYNISSKQFRDVFLQVLRCHLTLEHVNVEKLRRAHQNSAARSTAYKRPLISMKRNSTANRQSSFQTFRDSSDPVPMASQQSDMKVTVQVTSGRNGVSESEI